MQKKYKIAMIGLGSIGKRHLINIDQVLKSKGAEYSIDLIRRKDSKSIDGSLMSLITNTYTEYHNVPDDYDIIFITNPTHLHYQTLKDYTHKAKHFFIEKPVFDHVDLDLSLFENQNVRYVACPLRYTAVIQYLKKNLDLTTVYGVRAISSSYLPDWRPDIDYRKTYSAHLSKGGGVSIDLIHEWDYLVYLFGKPTRIQNYRGKFSDLEIDSDDLSVYIAEYHDKLAEVHLDYFGRQAIRQLQLFAKDVTIVADILNSEIYFSNTRQKIRFEEDRNTYQIKEIEHFFDIVDGKSKNTNDITMALITLKIAKEGKL